ncbi:hypothetical protein Daus18300_005459 [Diaporthe australafricana]|uniref:Uncharacterized protein n=1 Tax=Diaporthe australafricana TaxID=127596 RepID=A0ABR3X140_9PEZI
MPSGKLVGASTTFGKDKEKSDDGRSSGASDTEQYGATQETSNRLSRRWQDSFAYTLADEDSNSQPCTHNTFFKASRRRESLGEPQIPFNSDGILTYEVFDLLAKKYEECLDGEDFDFEKLQTTRFTDSLVESPTTDVTPFGQAIEGEDVSGAAEDSRSETASLVSASDASSIISSDASHVSLVSDMGDEVQIDIEEALEKLLVKRRTLQKEKPLTDEDELSIMTYRANH